MSDIIKSFKGFDKDLKCRDFQYEIGGEYETDSAKACQKGFHACEVPLDVLNYYKPATSRYCEVEQSGILSKDGKDSKVASSKIKIGAEIGIPGLVKAQIEWVKKTCEDSSEQMAKDGHAAAQGDEGHAAAQGWKGHAEVNGKNAIAAAFGVHGAVKACHGSWIMATEWRKDNKDEWEIACVLTAKVDGENIKPDTWYAVKGGKFVEVN